MRGLDEGLGAQLGSLAHPPLVREAALTYEAVLAGAGPVLSFGQLLLQLQGPFFALASVHCGTAGLFLALLPTSTLPQELWDHRGEICVFWTHSHVTGTVLVGPSELSHACMPFHIRPFPPGSFVFC